MYFLSAAPVVVFFSKGDAYHGQQLMERFFWPILWLGRFPFFGQVLTIYFLLWLNIFSLFGR